MKKNKYFLSKDLRLIINEEFLSLMGRHLHNDWTGCLRIAYREHYLKPLTNIASLPNVKCRRTCYSGKCTSKFDQIDSIISLWVYIHINISISEIAISLYKERNQSLGTYLKCFCSYPLLGAFAHLNSR